MTNSFQELAHSRIQLTMISETMFEIFIVVNSVVHSFRAGIVVKGRCLQLTLHRHKQVLR
jgi:hypothetical protein